ncbi:MAG: acyl-CoA dehydratase activase [Promethearchaeota archaeon]
MKLNSNRKYQPHFFEGIEIGAVSVKWIRRSNNGIESYEMMRHEGFARKKIEEIYKKHELKDNFRIVATGQAVKGLLDLPYFSEVECLEKALQYYDIKPDILVSLGGETFSIYPMKNGVIKNIISSSKCAAGTGEFIVQQFQRMGFTIEDGIQASIGGQKVEMATRCSVHCKSDATHKLNKGECLPKDIARTLIFDLARKVSEMIELAKWSKQKIVLCGGVTLNKVFVEHFRTILSESEVIVLKESPFLEVFGASLFASELTEEITIPPFDKWFKEKKLEFDTHRPLLDSKDLLDYRITEGKRVEIIEGKNYILGIDAGSTTTKAVLLNIEDNTIGATSYLRTLGNPIQATKKNLEAIIQQIGNKKINIIQYGVTGSAREMVSVYLENCRSFNEILAHARGAIEEVPNVDTVFEIGGQDSKFISFLHGVPIDYAMNEGCSAGTGSFLEESASVDMGIPVTEISKIAEQSEHPIAFGERCAAFINTDLRNALQQGASREDVIAGLVYSIADNYISRIVGPRYIGSTLLFLGGVALNKAVALAMAARSQRKVVVPAFPELMGAIGTALMVKDLLNKGEIRKVNNDIKQLIQGQMEVKNTFRCRACANSCEIQRITIRGKTYPFGGLCSKYKLLRQYGKDVKEGKDLVAFRNKLMMEEFGPQKIYNPRGTIGLPMALTSYQLFPFYTKLINNLGYDVVLSEPSKIGNTKTCAPICYPCELVHGAIYDLLEKKVDFIFLPYVIELEKPNNFSNSYVCTSTSIIPDIINAAFENIKKKLLSPHISLSEGHYTNTIREIEKLAPRLKIQRSDVRSAVKSALKHYFNYRSTLLEYGKKFLEELKEESSVIIAGRPYTIAASNVNLALPRKIISRGYNAIPFDMIPFMENEVTTMGNVWAFTQLLNNAISYVKINPNLFISFVSCFSCGPDSIAYHLVRQELKGKTFCYLEIDSHTAHAGFETRIGAFLDIIEERKHQGNKKKSI